MIQKRYLSGKLNLDDSRFVLPKGDYADAYDISTTERYGGVKSMKGNRKVAYSGYTKGGVYTVVGAKDDLVRGRVIFFVSNSNKYHCVMEYTHSTRTIKKIFENLTDSGGVDILDLNGQILGINIIHKEEVDQILSDYIKANYVALGLGSLANALIEIGKTNKDTVYFLDAKGRPTFMNIDRMKWGVYKPVSRDIIDVAKDYPATVPVAVFVNDTTHRVNNLRNRLFKFKYAYIYDDNEATVWSPHSKVAYPKGSTSDEYTSVPTNNNRIDVAIPTGGRQVKKVKIAMSFSIDNSWSDFSLVETIDKGEYGLGDNATYTYKFYNDTVPVPIDLIDSIQLMDYVPLKAGVQEVVNGDTLLYADITEGFNPVIPNVEISTDYAEAGSIGGTGTLMAQFMEHIGGGDYIYTVIFTGTIVAGMKVKIMLASNAPGSTPYEYYVYTTVSGDTPNTVAANMAAGLIAGTGEVYSESASNNVLTFHTSQMSTGWHAEEVKIVNTPVGSETDSAASCWLPGTKRKIAFAYFDTKGRTRAAETRIGMEVTFPAYKEFNNVPMLPVINLKINHQPPVWANSYSILISENLSISNVFCWLTSDVLTDSDYIYFDVSGIKLTQEKNTAVKDVINYQYAKGDRLRLLGAAYDDTYDAEIVGYVTNPKINCTDETGKTFIKIKKANPFTPLDFSTNNFVIMMYSPTQVAPADKEIYREFGYTFKVLNPGTNERAHEGTVASQVAGVSPARFSISDGDVYLRSRKIYIADTTTISYYAFDMNFTDTYLSRVSSISGRPFAIDDEQEERRYINMIRFSHAYQANTNINGINKFLPLNFEEVEASYGEIKRMKARDSSLRVYQRLKVCNIPVYGQIIQDAAGNDTLSLSDKLLNRGKYYDGEFGIGNTPESLASDNFADYFVSSDRGVICRLSMDGITPISITEKVNEYAVSNLTIRGGSSRVHGVFDAATNRYIVAMEASGSNPAKTIIFNERKNGFECHSYLKPEKMVCLGTTLISFKGGEMYTHDHTKYAYYFGKQYTPSITVPFNEYPDQKKSFIALSLISSQLWECSAIETDTDQLSELTSYDFKKINGKYHASFLRDKKSHKGLLQGDRLSGHYIFVTLSPLDSSIETELTEVDVTFNPNHLNNR